MSKLRSLMEKIPGYGGYLEREARRDSDKKLRVSIADAFSSQANRLNLVLEQLLMRGDFDSMEALDRIIVRLQHLSDRIRTATYGFSGLFDQDKVDEAALDRMYLFDLELAEGVEKTGDLIAQLGIQKDRANMIEQLRLKVDELHTTFDQRGNHIKSTPTYSGRRMTETPVDAY